MLASVMSALQLITGYCLQKRHNLRQPIAAKCQSSWPSANCRGQVPNPNMLLLAMIHGLAPRTCPISFRFPPPPPPPITVLPESWDKSSIAVYPDLGVAPDSARQGGVTLTVSPRAAPCQDSKLLYMFSLAQPHPPPSHSSLLLRTRVHALMPMLL